jgi:DNA-binding Lrp family transcriptional regulator
MEVLNWEYIKQHQSFNDLEDLDRAVRAFLYRFKGELSEGTIKVLKCIWRHSVKVIGVSFAKYDYIAENVNLSRRTVIRAVNKLEEYGIIKRVPTVRQNGKRGVNLIVIQPIDLPLTEEVMSPQSDTADVTSKETENKQCSLCEKKKIRHNVNEPTLAELDPTFTPSNVNKEFVKAASPFFGAYKIYDLYKRVLIAYRKSQISRPLDDLIDRVLEAFKTTVYAFKMGKIRTFEGYFYRLLEVFFGLEKRRENRHLLYDFLSNEF